MLIFFHELLRFNLINSYFNLLKANDMLHVLRFKKFSLKNNLNINCFFTQWYKGCIILFKNIFI
jgi:hypothetical protein